MDTDLTRMDGSYFNEEEKKVINELRQRLGNINIPDAINEDIVIYNFLKARQFRMNDAEAMFLKHLKWRDEIQIEKVLADYKPIEVLDKYWSACFLGYDKQGSPIRYSPIGNLDVKGIFKSVTPTNLLKYELDMVETDIKRTKEQTKKLGKLVSQCLYIYNMEKWTLLKATDKKTLDYMLLASSLLQDNFPERIKQIIIVNAPVYFTITFSIVKTVLSSSLISKIKVFGTVDWKDELLRVIDEDVLPAFLGGKRTDPDGNPLCNTFVNHGYNIPEHYYFTNQKSKFLSLPEVRKIAVDRRDTVDVPINVSCSRSKLEWEFALQGKDIGFGLCYKDSTSGGSEKIELIPVQRVDVSLSTESGMYYCEKPGTYIFQFDNSHSRLTAKNVYYRIEVRSFNEPTVDIQPW